MADVRSGDVPRKLLPIIYVLDVSGSMTGQPIAALNEAMRETQNLLKEKQLANPNAKLRIGAMAFSSGAQWITGNGIGLEDLEDFFWNDLSAGGITDLGAALEMLYDKLSRTDIVRDDETIGYCRPIIIFISDGGPTDDWEKGLAKAKTNKWFKYSTRIAMAVGDNTKRGTDAWNVLAQVAGGDEAVLEITDLEMLKSMIRAVTMSASTLNSQSKMPEEKGTSDNSNAADVIKQAKEQEENSRDVVTGDTSSMVDNNDDELDDIG